LETGGQLKTRPIFHGERTPVPMEYDAGWAPELMWRLWRRKSFLPLPEFEPRISSHEPDNIKIVDLEKNEKRNQQ